MSEPTYLRLVREEKQLVWLSGEVKTPPLSAGARVRAGQLLRRLQRGERLGMPAYRPMPSIGPQCGELRISDRRQGWRIVLRVDPDAVVILEVFSKSTRSTPKQVLDNCRQRLRDYDRIALKDL